MNSRTPQKNVLEQNGKSLFTNPGIWPSLSLITELLNQEYRASNSIAEHTQLPQTLNHHPQGSSMTLHRKASSSRRELAPSDKATVSLTISSTDFCTSFHCLIWVKPNTLASRSQLHSVVLLAFEKNTYKSTSSLVTQIMVVFCKIIQSFTIKKDSAPHLTCWCCPKIPFISLQQNSYIPSIIYHTWFINTF